MKAQLSKNALHSFFSGQASPLQRKLIEEWLKEEKNKELFYEWMEEWEVEHPQFLPNTDEALKSYLLQLESPQLSLSNAFSPILTNEKLSSLRWYRYAAAVIVLAGIFFLGKDRIIYKYSRTAFGEVRRIELPDKSTVVLNANSVLRVPRFGFGKTSREVYLNGEAFFDVVGNPSKPFILHTSAINITVLGTAFNVKSYEDDERIETTLIEGKVVIEKTLEKNLTMETLELLPDQQATFDKKNRQIIVEAIDRASEVAWLSGSLVFENETFSEIIKDLERRYGVKIIVNDKSSLQCRFSTRIERESLAEVLKLFSLSGDAKFQFNADRVLVEGRLCNQTAK
jgi:ferric-dicitrate binding protein FerR (iron transport regulator)